MSASIDLSWGRYRTYLRFLAEAQLDPHWKAHVDLSGIVQQSMLEAHQAIELGHGNLTLPWLRRILANNLTDEVRRLQTGKRDVRREHSIAQAIEQSSVRLEAMLPDSTPTPSENLVRQEQVLELSLALERLPDTQREALMLQMWQGRSLDEIAAHMGKTPQAVAGLLKRGLRQLRQEMGAANQGSDQSTES